MRDLTKNKKAFGHLKSEEQEALKAWPHGLEMYGSKGDWISLVNPSFNANSIYRAIPAPELTPDTLDWSHVAEGWDYCARSCVRGPRLLRVRPTALGKFWCQGGDSRDASTFASYKRGTCDWKESLLVRPGVAT